MINLIVSISILCYAASMFYSIHYLIEYTEVELLFVRSPVSWKWLVVLCTIVFIVFSPFFTFVVLIKLLSKMPEDAKQFKRELFKLFNSEDNDD